MFWHCFAYIKIIQKVKAIINNIPNILFVHARNLRALFLNVLKIVRHILKRANRNYLFT